MKVNKSQALTVLVVLLAGALSGCSAFRSSSSAIETGTNEPIVVGSTVDQGLLSQGGLTVIGIGSSAAAPDMATINLGFMASDPEVDSAVDQASRVINDVKQALLALGIAESDLQTTGFNVWLEERFDPALSSLDPTRRIVRAENALAITVRDVSRIGEIIKAGLSAGANQVRGITFGLSDTTAIEEEARANAIAEASIHAVSLARQLGLEIGKPISATEIRAAGPFPASEFVRLQSGGGGGGPDISPGEVAVTVEVEVTYQILSR
jgi:hypothetical protein